MDNVNTKELIEDRANWPACPECGERTLLIGGGVAACHSCDFIGKNSQVEGSDLKVFAQTKLTGRFAGERGVVQFTDHDTIDHEEQDRVAERAAQVAQRSIHLRYLFQAGKHLGNHGKFTPAALLERVPESGPDLLVLNNDRTKLRLRERALGKDAVSVIWAGDIKHLDFLKPGTGDAPGLIINSHFYNAPSNAAFVPVEHLGDTALIDWSQLEFVKDARISSLIWQPVCWDIITNVTNHIQTRYLGVIEVERDLNVNIAVHDDLEGPTTLKIAFRTPWDTKDVEIRDYPVEDSDQAIALAKQKFQTVLEDAKAGRLIINQELEWGLDAHAHNITSDIRQAKLWETYAPHRTRN